MARKFRTRWALAALLFLIVFVAKYRFDQPSAHDLDIRESINHSQVLNLAYFPPLSPIPHAIIPDSIFNTTLSREESDALRDHFFLRKTNPSLNLPLWGQRGHITIAWISKGYPNSDGSWDSKAPFTPENEVTIVLDTNATAQGFYTGDAIEKRYYQLHPSTVEYILQTLPSDIRARINS